MMEKRVIIAFILSWLVLVLYQGLVKPKQVNLSPQHPVVSQITENKEVMGSPEKENVDVETAQEIKDEALSVFESEAVIEEFENEKLKVGLSNIGGRLEHIELKEYEFVLPFTNMLSINGFENYAYDLKSRSEEKVVYEYADANIGLRKIYDFSRNDYLVDVTLEITNKSNSPLNKKYLINDLSIDNALLPKDQFNQRNKGLLEYSISQNGQIFRKTTAMNFSEKEKSRSFGSIDWVGYRTRYYCSIIKQNYTSSSYMVEPINKNRLDINSETEELSIAPGDNVELNYIVYFGPQDLRKLKSYDEGFEKIVAFSRFGILNFISMTGVRTLLFFNKFIPNWGICIILLGFAVSALMYPLTMKGMTSMKRMQSLKPKMDKMREQHKNNPQKLNKEMMELYKEHKINPLGGCLPMLLQMPIFIALYQALWRSVYFKGASFLWIKDLTEPDRLFILNFSLPVIGNEINILPLIMMVLMFFQQKLTGKNMASNDPQQQMQQKIMGTVFPFFIGMIFYKFASGLALYFSIFYISSTFTQWKLSKITHEA